MDELIIFEWLIAANIADARCSEYNQKTSKSRRKKTNQICQFFLPLKEQSHYLLYSYITTFENWLVEIFNTTVGILRIFHRNKSKTTWDTRTRLHNKKTGGNLKVGEEKVSIDEKLHYGQVLYCNKQMQKIDLENFHQLTRNIYSRR